MSIELDTTVAMGGPVAICCKSQAAFDRAHRWALKQRRTSFLIPLGDWGWVAQMRRDHPTLSILTDTSDDARLSMLAPLTVNALEDFGTLPAFDNLPEQMAVVFTSGSTGAPRPFVKRASALNGELHRVRKALGESVEGALFVSTVPLEHTFGYSFAWWLPRVCGAQVRLERVVTPGQLRIISESSTRPLWIVTTPTHMKHCVELGLRLSNVAGVVCATSPLGTSLARQGAACYGVPITECYGSTETGSIAFRLRRTDEAVEPPWTLLPDATLGETERGYEFSVPYFDQPIVLPDLLKVDGRSFQILGRADDVIKVCGKRHSLSAMNRLIATIPAVADAHYFLPDATSLDETLRPTALVELRAGAQREDVLAALRGTVDDVFLPRPLIVVDRLPRGDSGKLRREDVLDVYCAHIRAQAAATSIDV
ncbi:AMP-binding protein [Paraburkholderia terricola]|uniref:Acyl-coenzyme A synthetase/AMP-(Fatty) acid ligase n=1 Tax=Paraburkholderia terricola TaxID=169427 RepID=A0ABU1M1H6_9BURK|nr:AMP-binding protein [Paraburkholderia terricola]MDR6412843.1 acyl-coenzyme A synthetase/AMP-(fatty) acid ligase [Paraburkholderia terricola]MDR6450051.1 acyl-coenzyme A synthetase/AMP-(fatty) acid ligase [Paraburkholderia terricola]MDR6484885.1 acyl-coenzyme A synthetase/AMP-(fatty) acid ligase [Paraburkholderia terricola]